MFGTPASNCGTPVPTLLRRSRFISSSEGLRIRQIAFRALLVDTNRCQAINGSAWNLAHPRSKRYVPVISVFPRRHHIERRSRDDVRNWRLCRVREGPQSAASVSFGTALAVDTCAARVLAFFMSAPGRPFDPGRDYAAKRSPCPVSGDGSWRTVPRSDAGGGVSLRISPAGARASRARACERRLPRASGRPRSHWRR